MKKNYILTLAALAVVLFATAHASSRSPVYFKAPIDFRGTGCPGENFAAVTGEGTDTISSIMFDQFDAAKPRDNAASGMMRSSCNFRVPVHLPAGFQLTHLTAEWRGYAEGKTKLRREYFFAGKKGPSKTTILPTPPKTEGDFILNDTVAMQSTCRGGNLHLRINSSVRRGSDPSYITVKSLKGLRLKWRKCL